MKGEIDQKKMALAKMEAICSRREYCSADIRERLLKFSLPEGAVEEIVESLKRERYLDDGRYAAAYARDKSSLAGWGPRKIEFALRGKGIGSEIIAQALEEVDRGGARERMQKVVLRKWSSLSKEEDVEKRRIKTIKFALGRGYSYEEVGPYVRSLR